MLVTVNLSLVICIIVTLINASHALTNTERTDNSDNKFSWPNGAKAAVNLSYDDALASQLDHAVPALNHYGFKGSFYLTLSAKSVNERLEDWRAIAKQGHELGNHTINHACRASLPNRQWVENNNNLDNKTMAQMTKEIIKANELLNAIDGQKIRTFTLPCGDNIVEGRDLLPEIAPYFVGIKSHEGVIPASMVFFNPMNAPVIAPSNVTGQALIAQVKQAAKNNSIVSFTFHGIGADHLAISIDAHQQLLDYLAKNKAIYWVDTFRNISLHITQNN